MSEAERRTPPVDPQPVAAGTDTPLDSVVPFSAVPPFAAQAPTGRPAWRTLADYLAPFVVAAAYVVFIVTCYPFLDIFEFDPDEGNNVIKALMLDRGYQLYTQIWNDQAPLFTYALLACFKLLGWEVNAARFLVLFLAATTIAALYDTLRITRGHAAALAAAAILPCTAHFIRLSVSVMLGLPALTLATLSVWALLRWHARARSVWLATSGVLMGLSLTTKLFTAFLVPMIGGWLVLTAVFRHNAGGGRWRIARPAALWSVCVVATVTIVLCLVISPAHFDQLYRAHLDARQAAFYPHEVVAESLHARLWRDFRVIGLAAIGTGLMLARWQPRLLLFPLWCIAAYLALRGHAPVWYHHHLLFSIPASAAAGVAVGELFAAGWRYQAGLHWVARIALRVTVAGLLVWLALVTAQRWPRWLLVRNLLGHRQDRFVVELMKEYQPVTKLVVVDRQMYAFRAGYPVPPNLSVTSQKRLATKNLTIEEIVQTVRSARPELVALSSRWHSLRSPWTAVLGTIRANYQLVFSDEGYPLRIYVRDDVAGDLLPPLLRAAERAPDVAAAHDCIGLLWAARGAPDNALARFRRAVKVDPGDARAAQHLGEAHLALGHYAAGFNVLKSAVSRLWRRHTEDELQREQLVALAQAYAWRRATCPDASQRDGAEAERLVRDLVALAGKQSPRSLEILAAALAAQGKFEQTQTVAADLARFVRAAADDDDLARLERQVAAYRERRPWTEPVPMPAWPSGSNARP